MTARIKNANLTVTAAVCLSLLAAVPAQAQQTNMVSTLYLGSSAELDFRIYSANGGSGTNGTNSDRIADSGAFNYSSSSPGTYIVGFSPGDSSPLTLGTTYTLVTFNSTNFASTDAADFTATPKGNFTAISGSFLLNTVSGGPGSLQFVLTGYAETPEPNALALALLSAAALLANPAKSARSRRRRAA